MRECRRGIVDSQPKSLDLGGESRLMDRVGDGIDDVGNNRNDGDPNSGSDTRFDRPRVHIPSLGFRV